MTKVLKLFLLFIAYYIFIFFTKATSATTTTGTATGRKYESVGICILFESLNHRVTYLKEN